MKNKDKALIFILIIIFVFMAICVVCLANNIQSQKDLEYTKNELAIVSHELAVAKKEHNTVSDILSSVRDELDITNRELNDAKDELAQHQMEVENLNQEIVALQGILFSELNKLGITITQRDIELIAKTTLGEAGNCTTIEQSAVIWCILNRVDASGQSIEEIITAPNQFHGYNPNWVIKADIYELTIDVLIRWQLEKVGVGNVGRTLPSTYLWFYGDGAHNYFRNSYDGDYDVWDWDCWNPYE